MEKTKILIIGINGFIGKHCADHFSKIDSYEVWGCDIIPESRDHYFYINPKLPDFDKIFKSINFDVCINCSGAANVSLSLEKPLQDFELNTYNVFRILEAIRLFVPNCKFLNLSSAAVYGNPEKMPIKESATVAPVSPYGYHKLMAELICREFHQFWDIPTLSLRIFSAYGPGLKKQIFWDLSQKLKSKPQNIELYGTGKETRDFIYIDDLVTLISIIVVKASFDGSVLNAANGKQVSIKEISDKMGKMISSDTIINFCGTNRKGDPINWEADIKEIKYLGYAPSVNIDEGINKFIKWLDENGLV